MTAVPQEIEGASSEDSWTRVRFGDVVKEVKDEVVAESAGVERYIAGEHMDSDDLEIRRWGTIGDGYLGPAFRRRFRAGNVLYGSRRTYLRKVAVAPFDGICANTTFICAPRDDRLSQGLLPYVMQCEAFHSHSIARSRGSVNPYVTWKDIASYEFWLPPPSEQQRIVDVLENARGTLETYRIAAERLDVATRASLAETFDNATSIRTAQLQDICAMQNGRPFPSADYQQDGVRLLRPGNLDVSGYVVWPDAATKYLPERYWDEAREFRVGRGDVVINLTAQTLDDGFMGRVCLAREDDECLLNQRIGRFSCTDAVLPEFLYRALQGPAFRTRADTRCTGSKIRHLYWAHIADFQIPLPTLDAQRATIARFRELDEAKAEAGEHRARLTALLSALREELLGRGPHGVH